MATRRSGLTTVSVPAPLRPLFMKAQAAVEAYFGERVEDPEHSTLSISGERYVLVRAASLSVEFFDLVTSIYAGSGPGEGEEVARGLLYDLAHTLGKSDAAAFAKRMNLNDPIELLSAGPVHFSFAGWAFVEIRPDSKPTPDEEFFLHYDHPYSFESDAWRRRGRVADRSVCVMNAGYSAGWCSECFGLPLAAVEVECQARGDARCRFVMAPPSRLAGHVERVAGGSDRMAVPVSMPEFFRRKRLEEEQRSSQRNLEERLRFLTDNLPSGMVYQLVMEPGGDRRFTYVSAGVIQAHGITPEAVYADPRALYSQLFEEDAAQVAALEEVSMRTLQPFAAEARFRLPSGETRWRILRSAPHRLPDGGTMWDGIELDVTDRKRAEEERAHLEERLRHRQRMESIGQLAGGVAHDFNNLLTAILGNVSVAMQALPPDGEAHECLVDAGRAAETAAHLTRQLLAFSRKQAVDPHVLDLNRTLEDLQKMLRRLLREDVALELAPAEGLGRVLTDPGQVEQILVNLVVNSRDAIPQGGTITLSTRNATLDEQACRAAHLEVAPGEYVVFSVSDDGTGMTPEVKAHLFEPFFTTKPPGKGTGLGLAMVYGAVKQAGGSVEVRSEPGRGTTVDVYLPRVNGAAHRPDAPARHDQGGGSETLLLVEDNDIVRSFARRVLRRRGYRVHDFPDGASALEAVERLGERVRLLVTDVVMPGMNGRVLSDRLRAKNPGLRVLFTSGYTQDAIVHDGVLEPGIDLLAKPYSPEELMRRVRELLDRE